MELLTTTRSVRLRLDLTRPVDLELVKDCLGAALQAPTGADRQDWRWVVVTDPALREAIGAVYRRAFDRRYAHVPDSGLARSARHLAANLGRVPVLVVACLETRDWRLPDENQAGLWGSILPAAWSYMLAARACGLATAWTSVHLDAEKEVADLLDLPETVRQAALIPTAHALGDGFRPARRRPLEDVLHIDRWSARTAEAAP